MLSFECLMETLECSSSKLLTMSDEMLGYTVFEVLTIDYMVYLQDYTFNRLLDKFIITDEIVEKCKELRDKISEIENSEFWDIKYVRTYSKWQEVMQLSDEIKKMIIDIWGENYIETVKENIY